MNDWKDCTALEAHQAWVAKTHGVDTTYSFKGAWQPWYENDGIFRTSSRWRYRIREKAKRITVEMPTPTEIVVSTSTVGFWVRFKNHTQRDAALVAINAAMEKA